MPRLWRQPFMGNIESALLNLGYLETLSYQDTPLHRLDPRVKLLTTLVFIIAVVSFGKYEITGLLPFIIFPVVLVAVGNLPPGYLAKKILLAAPFAFFIGIFNPLLDRTVLLHLGPLGISGGWVSFASIMLRFVLTVSAAFILIAGTGLNAVCLALEKLGAPNSFAVQLLFLYRYIFVLDRRGPAPGAGPVPAFLSGPRPGIQGLQPHDRAVAVAHPGPGPTHPPGHALPGL